MYRPSHAVTIANRVVTLLLAGALFFGIFAAISIAVGVARHGNSLLYGTRLRLPFELSPADLRPLPHGMEVTDWPQVLVDVGAPTTKQMLLRSIEQAAPL